MWWACAHGIRNPKGYIMNTLPGNRGLWEYRTAINTVNKEKHQ